MKIRAITTGLVLEGDRDWTSLDRIGAFNRKAVRFFEAEGFAVQSHRIATNPWEAYISPADPKAALSRLSQLSRAAASTGVHFFGIGPARTPEAIALIPEIIGSTPNLSVAADLGGTGRGLLWHNIKAASAIVVPAAHKDPQGYSSMRFCGQANVRPFTPFFPAAYHEGPPSFGIGMECGDLLVAAFENGGDWRDAETRLKTVLTEAFSRVETLARDLEKAEGMPFHGLDLSVAPSLIPEESVARAYEAMGIPRFGDAGTLALSALITRVLKNLPVKSCGYSGLMFPVIEDHGLARRADEGCYGIGRLLLYSSVCACGLDTVPVPGDISRDTVERLFLDVASLAIALDKPLAIRLFPIPGKKAGDLATFNSPYLLASKILDAH